MYIIAQSYEQKHFDYKTLGKGEECNTVTESGVDVTTTLGYAISALL